MGARSIMTMRCSTERDAESAEPNRYNKPVTHQTYPLTDSPCYWQSSSEQFVTSGEKLAAIASHMLLTPLTADVREQDTVTSITDRRGRTLKGERLRVMTVLRREDHLEIAAEEYG